MPRSLPNFWFAALFGLIWLSAMPSAEAQSAVAGGGTPPAGAAAPPSSVSPSGAAADPIFSEATAALRQGNFEQAIAGFERLSDMGVHDPAASYNRGLAYIQRSETQKRRSGDLGQAAAALREAELLGDKTSATLLQRVRERINHERARREREPFSVEAPLSWAIAKLLPENLWAWLSLIGAVSLASAVWLRRAASESPLRLAGNVLAGIGLGFVLIFGGLSYFAHELRVTTREAVIVVQEAPLLDESGNVVRGKRVMGDAVNSKSTEGASAIPEGASVFTFHDPDSGAASAQGGLLRVRWGALDAWVRATQVRQL